MGNTISGIVSSSNNIQVFPCGGRAPWFDMGSRVTSEYSLTSIINKLIDRDAFCITNAWQGSGDFLFNIKGYIFSVTAVELKKIIDTIKENSGGTLPGEIYAHVAISQSTVDGNKYGKLLPIDEDNIFISSDSRQTSSDDSYIMDKDSLFRGVMFTNNDEVADIASLSNADYNIYTLKLLQNITTNGDNYTATVPDESKIKFITDTEHNRSVIIDDGCLDGD